MVLDWVRLDTNIQVPWTTLVTHATPCLRPRTCRSAAHQPDFADPLGGEDLFRKWDSAKGKYRGAFLNTAYEVIAIGAGYLVARGEPVRRDVDIASQELSTALDHVPRFATGLATADRLVKVLPLGRDLMSDPPRKIAL